MPKFYHYATSRLGEDSEIGNSDVSDCVGIQLVHGCVTSREPTNNCIGKNMNVAKLRDSRTKMADEETERP